VHLVLLAQGICRRLSKDEHQLHEISRFHLLAQRLRGAKR
jgi:hypothetical protein